MSEFFSYQFFIGLSKDGRNNGLWATFCHLRHEGPRIFKPDSIKKLKVTSKKFGPIPQRNSPI